MGLFRRTPAAPLPGSQDPLAAHLAAIAAGREGAVGALVHALQAQQLWQAWREAPEDMVPGQPYVPTSEISIDVLSTTMPDGAPAMAVFSSPEAVGARSPQAVPVGRAGADLLAQLLADPSCAGLVLDPAGPGPYQVLLSQWVREGLAGRL